MEHIASTICSWHGIHIDEAVIHQIVDQAPSLFRRSIQSTFVPIKNTSTHDGILLCILTQIH